MDTQAIEYTTWHDCKPSHNPKPANLLDLEWRMNKAWQDYDALIEARYECYSGIASHEITHDAIQTAQDEAVKTQQAYYDACTEANK